MPKMQVDLTATGVAAVGVATGILCDLCNQKIVGEYYWNGKSQIGKCCVPELGISCEIDGCKAYAGTWCKLIERQTKLADDQPARRGKNYVRGIHNRRAEVWEKMVKARPPELAVDCANCQAKVGKMCDLVDSERHPEPLPPNPSQTTLEARAAWARGIHRIRVWDHTRLSHKGELPYTRGEYEGMLLNGITQLLSIRKREEGHRRLREQFEYTMHERMGLELSTWA